MAVTVLRLGHRPERDKRITTHVCLTARAFGADRVLIAERDDKLVENVRGVAKRFGGDFVVESGTGWKRVLQDFDGVKVHLTMYGVPVREGAGAVRPGRDLLVVVGAEKVPREVYDLVDLNVSVGNQPHSEVAALAVFLYEALGPDVLAREFPGAPMRIRPSARGKIVEGSTDEDPDAMPDDP
ncbi:MAG TPA: tRNA (cytidine(56)-2'-O)-methyltransferase [Candidatus Thermoplasmatota archaeon]|nr:tRNA (cytidine(56)-2'-O)-methyltransferase [Candidatus Thermoplasmatota archaeon]